MSGMDKERAVDKILKCLALSKSANEHEAAAALRQARALMEKFAVTDVDITAAQANEKLAKAGTMRRPVAWEVKVASDVADAFGCELIFLVRGHVSGKASAWSFVGCGMGPEIASYAFAVLLRQATAARRQYIATSLKRCGPSSKTKRADLFCIGWVCTATSTLSALIPTEEQQQAMAAYKAIHHQALSTMKPVHRGKVRSGTDDVGNGMRSGRGARLNHAMTGSAGQVLLEG